MATVILDHREHSLRQLFDAHCQGHSIKPLPVGDAHVSYPNGDAWIAERKKADDLAVSIRDGRWKDQCGRLFTQTEARVVIVVEGFLGEHPMREKVQGAYENMVLRGVLTFRTACVQGTFELLCALVNKLQPSVPRQLPPRKGVEAPRLKLMQSKRERNSEPTVIFTRILCSIPSISESIAEKLVSKFKDLPRLQRALVENEFPEIQVSTKKKIGRARLDILRRTLCDPVGDKAPKKTLTARRKSNSGPCGICNKIESGMRSFSNKWLCHSCEAPFAPQTPPLLQAFPKAKRRRKPPPTQRLTTTDNDELSGNELDKTDS